MPPSDYDQEKRKPALEGIRVLDLATFVAAPFAATLMSEFGAEVIKIEHPKGGDPWRRYGTPTEDGDSLAWKSESRNKRSLTLDLGDARGREVFKRLAASADVVAENFRPGKLESWDLGWDALGEVNPRLVLLRVSGFGQTGPYRDRPGFARIAHAFGGLTHLAGMPDGPPVTPGSTSLADYITGLFGAVGVLVALRARDRDGLGQVVDVSLYESIFRVLDEIAPAYAATGRVRGREGLKTLYACPHGQYQTAEGHWVAVACTSDRMFARFAEMMGQPELAAEDRFGNVQKRLAALDEVDGIVTDYIRSQPREAFLARCLDFGVPAAPVNTIADIFADPHIRERGTLLEVDDGAGGTITVPNVVARLSETPGQVRASGPALGEATDTVLREMAGLSDDDIRALREAGVI
ncbi:CaiB/BaiF CoA transferase family protein [Dichotomicrobium thermohalophilum]|uniref:Succinyl-CoA:(S)-malate CoA-transferase subunit B n=1 Tax=Dichotomicrobium thermohalophilum TaxID=933063 RepID=A0A397QCA1_9HYPH|nr:CoA transferase [Dichotomicrobium thermohalophilum]RIA55724.1 succinyl-CoA:(S)-malate CoA-transferase subunit B [Dichotomicrobium thermohalophilum]